MEIVSAVLGKPRPSFWMALAFGVPIAVLGCETLFNIRVDGTAATTVPAATPLETLLGDFGFGELVDMDVTQAQELRNQGVEPGDISHVVFLEFTLEAVDPSGADLSFIDDLELWVEAPGLDDVRVAWQDDFPVGQALVEMHLDDVDLVDYAVSESMTIRSEITGSRPDEATEVEATYALRVGVTRQGCKSYQQQN